MSKGAAAAAAAGAGGCGAGRYDDGWGRLEGTRAGGGGCWGPGDRGDPPEWYLPGGRVGFATPRTVTRATSLPVFTTSFPVGLRFQSSSSYFPFLRAPFLHISAYMER